MAQAGSIATNKLESRLTATSGMAAALSVIADLEGIELPPFSPQHVVAQNVAPEIIERSHANRYPTLHIYCSKVVNLLREKFRTFSGEAHLVIEVRLSQDRLDNLDTGTQLYVDAATRVLDENRGDWGDGVFYGGGYEINFGPVKHGGKNFLQIAKISFTVDISTN